MCVFFLLYVENFNIIDNCAVLHSVQYFNQDKTVVFQKQTESFSGR